ncbi:MAG TPA: replication initiator, partial [Acidimicrobiales bacterium]|nr:replication initiator [Acidimicrobiales bacterium]
GPLAGALAAACLAAARTVRVAHVRGETSWGDQVDVEVLDDREGSRAGRLASYVAKYAVNSSTADGALDQRIRNAEDLAARRLSSHERRQVATAWRLGAGRDRAHLRRYAHCFGYGGHFLTKSRRYSTTLGALRRARAEWRATRRPRCGADVGAVSYESRWRAVGVGWKNRGEAIHAEEQREHYFENKQLAIEALAEERQQLG